MIINPSTSVGWISTGGFGFSGSVGTDLWVAGEEGVSPWAELAIDQRLGKRFSLGVFLRGYFIIQNSGFFKFPIWPVGGVAFKTSL